MGKILGYYCPMCGSEFSELYNKNECSGCGSLLFAKFDLFPFKKHLNRIIKTGTSQLEYFESIIPIEHFEPFGAILHRQETMTDGGQLNLLLYDLAKNISGVGALFGIEMMIQSLPKNKIPPLFLYDESVYAAIVIRNFLSKKFKIIVPDVIGEQNINSLLQICNEIDVLEGKHSINKVFDAIKNKNILDYHWSNMAIEGQKLWFYQILHRLSLSYQNHFIIPFHRIDLILALFKLKTELDRLGEKIQHRFKIHLILEKERLNAAQQMRISWLLKSIKAIVKSMGGSILEISEGEILLEKRKARQRLGVVTGNDTLSALASARLLYEDNKIQENETVVVMNYTNISHEFKN